MKQNVVATAMLFASVAVLAGCHGAGSPASGEHTTAPAPVASSVPPETTAARPSPMIGRLAPAFRLTTLDGKKRSLAEFKGRPVVLNFWATWCAPCRLEMPWFEALGKKYSADKLQVLGIAQDDAAKQEIEKAAKKAGVSYPILLTDGKSTVAMAYGSVDTLPTTFYVNREGVITDATTGIGSRDEIEARVKKLIASK